MVRESAKRVIVALVLAQLGIENDGSVTFEGLCDAFGLTEKEVVQAFAEGVAEGLTESMTE